MAEEKSLKDIVKASTCAAVAGATALTGTGLPAFADALPEDAGYIRAAETPLPEDLAAALEALSQATDKVAATSADRQAAQEALDAILAEYEVSARDIESVAAGFESLRTEANDEILSLVTTAQQMLQDVEAELPGLWAENNIADLSWEQADAALTAAKQKLDDAQKAYDAAVEAAGPEVSDAQSELDAAKAYLDAATEAYEQVNGSRGEIEANYEANYESVHQARLDAEKAKSEAETARNLKQAALEQARRDLEAAQGNLDNANDAENVEARQAAVSAAQSNVAQKESDLAAASSALASAQATYENAFSAEKAAEEKYDAACNTYDSIDVSAEAQALADAQAAYDVALAASNAAKEHSASATADYQSAAAELSAAQEEYDKAYAAREKAAKLAALADQCNELKDNRDEAAKAAEAMLDVAVKANATLSSMDVNRQEASDAYAAAQSAKQQAKEAMEQAEALHASIAETANQALSIVAEYEASINALNAQIDEGQQDLQFREGLLGAYDQTLSAAEESLEDIEARIRQLEQELEIAENDLKEKTEAYNKAVEEENLVVQPYVNMTSALYYTKTAMDDAERDYNALKDANSGRLAAIEQAQKDLDDAKTKWNEADITYKECSDAIEKVAIRIGELDFYRETANEILKLLEDKVVDDLTEVDFALLEMEELDGIRSFVADYLIAYDALNGANEAFNSIDARAGEAQEAFDDAEAAYVSALAELAEAQSTYDRLLSELPDDPNPPSPDDPNGDDPNGDDPNGDDPNGDDPNGDDPNGDDNPGDNAGDNNGDDQSGSQGGNETGGTPSDYFGDVPQYSYGNVTIADEDAGYSFAVEREANDSAGAQDAQEPADAPDETVIDDEANPLAASPFSTQSAEDAPSMAVGAAVAAGVIAVGGAAAGVTMRTRRMNEAKAGNSKSKKKK